MCVCVCVCVCVHIYIRIFVCVCVCNVWGRVCLHAFMQKYWNQSDR